MASFAFEQLSPASFIDRADSIFANRLGVVDGAKQFTCREFAARGRSLACIYVDPDGKPTGLEDVLSKLENAPDHNEEVGLGTDYVNRFIK